ncbi:Phage integrase family protein [Kosakonia radicincitans]|uniref:tyrosine-type recombinase/integrase n=1 Tax=Kosakonia radicincitans TaxID=283686 RepID=UPI0009A6DB9D|nr:tyrosine-type recombinase/integrase [Kosakonia radicincitans]SKC22424.1 Phage integrase family protein [Kosakonia radicincitans]
MAIKAHTKQTAAIRVSEWVSRYLDIQNERVNNGELAKKTVAGRKSCISILQKKIPNMRLKDVDTKIIAAIIDEYKDNGKARMGQLIRASLIDFFKEAQHSGEVPPGHNPALAVRNPRVKVQRSRMTFEQWKIIFETAGDAKPFIRNSMLLALVTGQRRGDLVSLKFSDIWDGHLHIKQNKTGAKIAIPLNIRCDAIGMTLSDVISRCRDHVVSKYLIHHTRKHNSVKAGDPVDENSLSRSFLEIRNKAGISAPKGYTPISFHEQRSLSSRLYKEQGIDVKTLLGHSTDAMSDQYRDDRGLDWKKLII